LMRNWLRFFVLCMVGRTSSFSWTLLASVIAVSARAFAPLIHWYHGVAQSRYCG
jgi:hypothetical protein